MPITPTRRTLCTWLLAAASLPGTTLAQTPVVLRIHAAVPGAAGAPVKPGAEIAGLDMAALLRLPQQTFRTRTPWYPEAVTFKGPLLRDVLALAKAKGHTLHATALDDYRIKIPFSDAQRFDMILAHQIDGKTLTPKDKGPLFVVYPYDSRAELQSNQYYERSIWQLKTLTVE